MRSRNTKSNPHSSAEVANSRSFFRRPELCSSLPLPAPWWPCAESLWRCFPCISCTKRARSWHIPLCTACSPETPPCCWPERDRRMSHKLTLPGNFSPARRRREAAATNRAQHQPRNRAEEPACPLHDIKEGAARTGGLTPSRIPYPLRWMRRSAHQPNEAEPWRNAHQQNRQT